MPNLTNQAPDRVRRQGMLARLLATLVKVAVASLIVGTILAHFGITAEQVLKDFGITPERLAEMARQGFEPAARLADHRAGVAVDLSDPPAGGEERVASRPTIARRAH
jgi:acetyl-CoA acetyltransferase